MPRKLTSTQKKGNAIMEQERKAMKARQSKRGSGARVADVRRHDSK